METLNDFKKVNDEYENKLFEIFRTAIDTAISYAIEQKMSYLDRYVYVNNALENAYRELAYVQGYIPNPDFPYKANPYLSDDLTERIYSYIEPITNEAREELQKEVDKIVSSTTLGELMEKLEVFQKMLSDKGVDSFIYEDLDIKKRV